MRAAGNKNGNHKLTPERVQAVRDAVRLKWPQRAVAAATGLSQSTVSDICSGRLWRELPDTPTAEVLPVALYVEPRAVDDDLVLLIRGNTATELRRVDVVLCRPLTAAEQLQTG